MNNKSRTKQVIIIRDDLDINVGKVAAQAAHASLGVLLGKDMSKYPTEIIAHITPEESEWLKDDFTKVVLKASKGEILQIYDQAIKLGLNCCKIVDSGYTFFNGEETLTSISLGPNYNEKIDELTKNLKLYQETPKEERMRKILEKIYKEENSSHKEEIKEILWNKK